MLAGVDLRGQDLTDRDLRDADLHGADLQGMRMAGTNLAGADLRDADLTGVRMVGGSLTAAQLSGSRWHRAALLGVSGLDGLTHAPELAVAAVAGRDPADVMIAPAGDVSCVAFSPDSTLIALFRGSAVEIVESGEPPDLARPQWPHRFGAGGGVLSGWCPVSYCLRRSHRPAVGPQHRRVASNAAGARRGSHAVLLPDGSYKLDGDPGRSLWWAIKLCRFAPGELDPYDTTIRRLTADAPFPGRRIVRRMPRMQVYLPDELHRQVKQEGLPVSEILQVALREELSRREKLAAIEEYLQELVAEVGEPTAEDYARAERLAAQIRGEDALPEVG